MNSPVWVRQRKEYRDTEIVGVYQEVLREWKENGSFAEKEKEKEIEEAEIKAGTKCKLEALPEDAVFVIAGYVERGYFAKAPKNSYYNGKEFNAVRVVHEEDETIHFERWYLPLDTKVITVRDEDEI